jgi:predicted lactoylglutathione lyase
VTLAKRAIFINLPVHDLPRAKAFYEAQGFAFNAQFTDENAAAVVISDTIHVMLLVRPFFQGFLAERTIADAHTTTECLLALTCADRAAVDDFVARGIAAGGREARAAQDLGFMYSRAVADPDGHVWEPFWMDPAHVAPPA